MLVDINIGHVEMHENNTFKNGKMFTYGFSIKYDRKGNEVSRTDPILLSIIGYSDNSNFTEKDLLCFQKKN